MTVHLDYLKPLLKSSFAPPRKTRRGVTVVQFAFFLVLAAVVTGTAISTFADVRQSARQGQALSILTRTYLAVQDIGGTSRNYVPDTDLILLLDASSKIPAEARRIDGGTVTMETPFDTPIKVVGNGGQFTITFVDYAKDDCRALLKNLRNVKKGQAGLKSLSVGGQPVTMPATAMVLDAACNEADDVAIAFVYF